MDFTEMHVPFNRLLNDVLVVFVTKLIVYVAIVAECIS